MLAGLLSFLTALMVTIAMVWPAALVAADDPSIKGQLRADIQSSMEEFIDSRTKDGGYLHYDAAKGEVLTFNFKELQSGIVKKGDFYVCFADFTDSSGRLFDLDFLVRPVGAKLQTSQAIVHAVDGTKRAYHLESK